MLVMSNIGPRLMLHSELLELFTSGKETTKFISVEHLIEGQSITGVAWKPISNFQNKASRSVRNALAEALGEPLPFTITAVDDHTFTKNPALDVLVDVVLTDKNVLEIAGELLNGGGNLVHRSTDGSVFGIHKNVRSRTFLNRPVTEMTAAYLKAFGPKLENTARNWQRFTNAVGQHLLNHAGLRAALTADGKDATEVLQGIFGVNGQILFDFYRQSGGSITLVNADVAASVNIEATGDCNLDGYLIDDTGQFIDQFGNSIDSNGFAYDTNGNYVSEDGRAIDYNGDLVDSGGHTIDAQGNPLDVDPRDDNLVSDEDMADIRDGIPVSNSPDAERRLCRNRCRAADREANEELDWGVTVGGTEEMEGMISLEDSQFFAETEVVNGQVVIKGTSGKPRLKLLPRAARKDGLILRTPGSLGTKVDPTESAAGNNVKIAPEGVPFESYYGDVVPYEGILDADMSMTRYIEAPSRFGYPQIDRISQMDFHGILGAAITERFADVASRVSPLSADQAKGLLASMGHLQKSISAKTNRITRPLAVEVAEIVGRSSEAASNFATEKVNSLHDAFNTARGTADAYVTIAATVAKCGANCVTLTPQSSNRLTISRGAAKQLSTSTLRTLQEIHDLVKGAGFASSFSSAATRGDWLASDILAKGGFTEEAFASIWKVVGAEMQDMIGTAGFSGQADFESVMAEWGAALDSELLTFDTVTEQIDAYETFNQLAPAGKQLPRSLKRGKTAGWSSKTTACSRSKVRSLSQKKLDLLQMAKDIDTTATMFSEGVYTNQPPSDGWIASDIIDQGGDSKGAMDNIMDAVADVVITSVTAAGDAGTWEAVQTFMNQFETDLRADSITSVNVNEHLNGVRAYNKIQSSMAGNGQTRTDASRPQVDRIPLDAVGTLDEQPSDASDMQDLIDFVLTARTLVDDPRIGNGDLSGDSPDPDALFKGATTLQDAVDSLGMAVGSAALTLDASGNRVGLDGGLLTKWKSLINRKALRLIMVPMASRDVGKVSDYESHLNSFNAAVGESDQVLNTADLLPADHIRSVLTMDTLDQVKELLGSSKIYPFGDPTFDDAREAIPSSLYDGATSEGDALDRAIADTLEFVQSSAGVGGGGLTARQKLQVRRIGSNLAKRALTRDNDLQAATIRNAEMGQDDIATYNRDVDLSNKVAGSDDGRATTESFPSFTSPAGQPMVVKRFSAYKNIVAGSTLGNAAKRFAGSVRKTLLGKPRASVGTTKPLGK
ncbi:hypothetical protein HKX48_006312 [Thoreauomyces humboldtii]|nr:hypothetical protein HKX48_006312 [Thoreauomyces humboldtii]